MPLLTKFRILAPPLVSCAVVRTNDQSAGNIEENVRATISILHLFYWGFLAWKRQAGESVQFCEVCVFLLSKLSSIKIKIIVWGPAFSYPFSPFNYFKCTSILKNKLLVTAYEDVCNMSPKKSIKCKAYNFVVVCFF